jgi:hypothetical protein
MDFPKGGGVTTTREWLNKKGFPEDFLGWEADAILSLDKNDVVSAVSGANGLKLWGYLNRARPTTGNKFICFAIVSRAVFFGSRQQTLINHCSWLASDVHCIYCNTFLGSLDSLLNEKLASMQLEINQIVTLMNINKATPKGPTTTAQLWRYGVQVDGSITLQDDEFSQFLQDLASPLIAAPVWPSHGEVPACIQGFVAQQGTPEKDRITRVGDELTTIEGTQAHFTRAMETILRAVSSGPAGLSAQFHTRAMTGKKYDEIPEARKLGCIPDAAAHKTARFLRRNPDSIFYDHPTNRSTTRIVFFGALKGHSSNYFTDTERGEILDLAMGFLSHVQPERPFIIVFLSNSRAFQFFKVMRDAAGGFVTKESEMFDGVEDDQLGWQVSLREAVLCCTRTLIG